jgi:hypothetical protein
MYLYFDDIAWQQHQPQQLLQQLIMARYCLEEKNNGKYVAVVYVERR